MGFGNVGELVEFVGVAGRLTRAGFAWEYCWVVVAFDSSSLGTLELGLMVEVVDERGFVGKLGGVDYVVGAVRVDVDLRMGRNSSVVEEEFGGRQDSRVLPLLLPGSVHWC